MSTHWGAPHTLGRRSRTENGRSLGLLCLGIENSPHLVISVGALSFSGEHWASQMLYKSLPLSHTTSLPLGNSRQGLYH